MKLRLLLAITFFLLLLSGCTTPYQPKSATGGFTDTKIDEKTWRIKFDGNGYTPKDMVWNFWIYRCASLTIEKGYVGMVIQSAKNYVPETPAKSAPQGKINLPYLQHPLYVNRDGGYFKSVRDNNEGWSMRKGPYAPSAAEKWNFEKTKGGGYYYYYSPGGAYTVTTWHSDGIVHMFNESDVPLDAKAWFRAATIVELLKPYVDSSGKTIAPSQDYILSKAMVLTGKAF